MGKGCKQELCSQGKTGVLVKIYSPPSSKYFIFNIRKLCVILYYFPSPKPWHLKLLWFSCSVHVNTPYLLQFKQHHGVTRFSDPKALVPGGNWSLLLLPDLCESWACCCQLAHARLDRGAVLPGFSFRICSHGTLCITRCFTKTPFKIIMYLQMNWKLFSPLSLQRHYSVKCNQKIEGLRIFNQDWGD